MNNYSNGKCFEFGKMVRGLFPDDSWAIVSNSVDFTQFANQHHITEEQLGHIDDGFHGKAFRGNKKEPPKSVGVFSFGAHKGLSYDDVPDSYIEWLSKQAWVKSDHPQLSLYIKEFMEDKKKNSLTPEETAAEFKKIKESIK